MNPLDQVNSKYEQIHKKKISYFILGVLPATFWSVVYLALMNSSTKLGAYILVLAVLSGTAGLYIITFLKKHNTKVAVILLFIGQIVMIFAIFDLGVHPIRSDNDLTALGIYETPLFTTLVFWVINVFRLLLMSTPIMVALHYQFTVYKQWRSNKV